MKFINFKNELENIPGDLRLGKSNAFPWVTKTENTEYLTFRSAPLHFPSNDSQILVLKRKIGDDSWKLEHKIWLNKDLREPRMVNLNGKLLSLYFCALKRSAIFNPESIMISEKINDMWIESKNVYKKGFMVYSVKNIKGVLYMTCYNKEYSSKCYFLTSEDGHKWKDVFPDKNIEKYLTCETDFIFKNGFWYFVSRNEFGKFDTYGSEIYKFNKNGNLVKHIHSELKFDGPFLFEKDNEVLLIARKNLSNNGKFLLSVKPVKLWGHWLSNLYYWLTPKKTAIWKINSETLKTEFVIDLPSNGDTSYASVLQSGNKTKIFYYSSSPRSIKSWVMGQLDKTSIYSVEII